MKSTLQQIIDQLWDAPEYGEWKQKTDTVPLGDVEEWITSDDIEVLGFTHGLLSDRKFRVEPPISLPAYIEFTKQYFARCIRENPDGQWSDTRYGVGGSFVNLFGSLWRDQSLPRTVLADLKNWLANTYREGDSEIRTSIVHATLEHLFEQEPIRHFFADWKNDPLLAKASNEAEEWYKGGGNSPLGKPGPT